MTWIVLTLSRTLHSITAVDVLKQFALFCGAVLLVAVLWLAYGIDLSPGLL